MGKDPILETCFRLTIEDKSSLDVNVCGASRLGVFVEVIFVQKVVLFTKFPNSSQKIYIVMRKILSMRIVFMVM